MDFTVKFNWDVGTNVYNTVTTKTDVTSLLCDVSKSVSSNIPSTASYSYSGTTDIGVSVGVAITGALILNGVSANNVDPFYPSPTSYSAESVDVCLGHPNP